MSDVGSVEAVSSARAVLFDLDGVLVDSSPVIDRVWRVWAERHGVPWDVVVPLLPGRRASETVALLAPQLDAVAEGAELERVQAADLAGIRACPGAVELTEELSARTPALPWAIVTSGSRGTATSRLRAMGFRIPAVLVTADDVAQGKPAPEGYLSAAEQLGVPPRDCLVVEDAAVGVSAARAAGARVAGIAGAGLGGAEESVDLVIGSPADLLGVVGLRGGRSLLPQGPPKGLGEGR
ncbi:HAD-IA family hydrolase [Streptomyces sp. NPDC002018]|uniref:HAD-IA family hydrolase n=1 Tax=Streptomyces sp. NPDC002018 TaxID=3364629 RepID=UPI0036A80F5A